MSFFSQESAAQACQKISSAADKIRAQAKADNMVTSAVVQGLLGPLNIFNPQSYKAGETETEKMTRNILESDLSTQERVDIYNSCSNAVASKQTNTIDTSKCKYCETHRCQLSNIKQVNDQDLSQACIVQTTVKKLLEKKNSVNAQALAEVLQSADGALSRDSNSTINNCNIIKTDMSTDEYLDVRNNCSNVITQDQTNDIQWCGAINDVIQENRYKNFQNCVTDIAADQQTLISSKQDVVSTSVVEQKSEGITQWASLIGIIVFCIIVLSVISIGFWFFTQATPEGEMLKQSININPDILKNTLKI